MAKKRILLVDDEVELVRAVQARLEANDYEVLTAYDGEEGLKKAKEEKLDLIILDLMLPKMNGFQVCATLKRDEQSRKVPVLLFTARTSEEDKRIGIEDCHADGYLTKPFEAQVFLKTIKELMGS